MSDEFFAGVSLLIAIFVTIPIYRFARYGKTKKRRFIERAQKLGHCVVGEYESSKVLPGDIHSSNPRLRSSSLDVKYRYTVEGIDYYKSIIFQSRGRIGTDFPNQIKVYYDARNPRKAVCLEEAHSSKQIESGCLTAIVVMGLVTFIVYRALKSILG